MWHRNIKAQNFLILIFSFLGIAGSVYALNLKTDISPEERHQIETEVFSILVDYLTIHPQIETDYIFLGISGSDPSPKILDTFHGNSPAVEPISSSVIAYGFSAPVIHKTDPEKRGIQVDLHIPVIEPNGDVIVLASLYQDKAALDAYEYKLNKMGGIYRVVSVKRP